MKNQSEPILHCVGPRNQNITFKRTVMQMEQALVNDHLSASKVIRKSRILTLVFS